MFTVSDIQTLRERTGVGMMDCKKALTETDGNIEKAIEYLREKGMAGAAKKAGRIAAEGIVNSCHIGNQAGVLLEVNCETDFVAKSDKFNQLVCDLAFHIAKAKPEDETALMEQTFVKNQDRTITQVVNEAIASIGEKISIRRFVRYEIDAEGIVDSYIHLGGKVGVLLEVNCETDSVTKSDKFKELVHNISLHIAAAKPEVVSAEDMPKDKIEAERKIIREQAKNEPKPKPEAVIEKMVEGRIKKFLEESVLMEQKFVKEPDKTITQVVNEAIASIGEKISIRRFTRYEMGEGIEKRKENLADEIEKMKG